MVPIRAWAGITTPDLLALPPCVLHHGVYPRDWGKGNSAGGPSAVTLKWAQPQNFATLQLFQLILHVCRAVAQLQPSIDLTIEIPPEIRSEFELASLNAGLHLPMLPPLAACRIPPDFAAGALQPAEVAA